MGNACQFPRHCLHMFVPAKITTVGGHGESDPHTQRMVCGMNRIHIQYTRVHDPAVTINIGVKEKRDNTKPAKENSQASAD